jgi:hypothetical protein
VGYYPRHQQLEKRRREKKSKYGRNRSGKSRIVFRASTHPEKKRREKRSSGSTRE